MSKDPDPAIPIFADRRFVEAQATFPDVEDPEFEVRFMIECRDAIRKCGMNEPHSKHDEGNCQRRLGAPARPLGREQTKGTESQRNYDQRRRPESQF